jgi:hypothetical protein
VSLIQTIGNKYFKQMASGSSTVVELTTHNPKIEGLNAATGTGEERERER